MSGVLPGFSEGVKNSPGGLVGGILTGGILPALSGIGGAFNGVMQNAPQPSLQAPTNSLATQPNASTTSIQKQLAKEQNARATSTILTSPSGLHDEPTATSSLLTGA